MNSGHCPSIILGFQYRRANAVRAKNEVDTYYETISNSILTFVREFKESNVDTIAPINHFKLVYEEFETLFVGSDDYCLET